MARPRTLLLPRRTLLWGAPAAALVACAPEAPSEAAFLHGVAAGDPTADGAVIWTRLSGVTETSTVHYLVASDATLTDVLASGTAEASPDRDFTVKVDVRGLSPARTLHYAFDVLTPRGLVTSPVGRFRTLPTSTDQIALGVCSCASYAHGFFHGYRAIAERELDLVLHLGDFIYEYGSGEYGSLRPYEPTHECRTVADYRARYAQYRRDPALQALASAHAVQVLWDDHEFANNASEDGSPWHDAMAKGIPWSERREAARRAFFEWQPVRDEPSISRALPFGDLCEVVVLDARMEGRTRQPSSEAERADPARRIVSLEREAWLLERLGRDDVGARLLASQVLFAQHPELFNWDAWEGYPAQRGRVLQAIAAAPSDVILLAGDSHASWACDVALDPFGAYDPATGDGSIAVELGVPGISSPNLDPASAPAEEARIYAASPHTRYTDQSARGFLVLTIDRDGAQAEHVLIDGVTDPGGGTLRTGAMHTIAHGARRLTR